MEENNAAKEQHAERIESLENENKRLQMRLRDIERKHKKKIGHIHSNSDHNQNKEEGQDQARNGHRIQSESDRPSSTLSLPMPAVSVSPKSEPVEDETDKTRCALSQRHSKPKNKPNIQNTNLDMSERSEAISGFEIWMNRHLSVHGHTQGN